MRVSYLFLAKVVVVVSFLTDPLEALLFGLPITLAVDALLVLTTGYMVMNARMPRQLRWMLVLLGLALLGMALNGRHSPAFFSVLSSRALFMFIVNMWFFLIVFAHTPKRRFPEFMSFLILLLKINVVVILVEGAVINFVAPHMYQTLASSMSEYRTQPHPVFFDAVPNGLVLGIQNGGILSVAGVLAWFPWNRWKGVGQGSILWFSLSLIAWLLTLTGTTVFVFAIVLIVISISGVARAYTPILGALAVGLASYLFLTIESLVQLRYSSESLTDIGFFIQRNIDIYLQPMEAVRENWGEALIGTGHMTPAIIQNSPLLRDIESADFGLLMGAVRFGFVLLPFALLFFFAGMWAMAGRVRRWDGDDGSRHLMISGLAILLALFFSSVHYMTLTEAGPAHYFAAMFALIYWWSRSRGTRAARRETSFIPSPRQSALAPGV